jgi:putative endonuclease
MYYIYILYSSGSDLFYVGHSDDPWRRLEEHNNSPHCTFTSKHRPWEIAGIFQAGEKRADAVQVERFIKNQKSRSFIEKLVSGQELTKKLSQLVRVPHLRD